MNGITEKGQKGYGVYRHENGIRRRGGKKEGEEVLLTESSAERRGQQSWQEQLMRFARGEEVECTLTLLDGEQVTKRYKSKTNTIFPIITSALQELSPHFQQAESVISPEQAQAQLLSQLFAGLSTDVEPLVIGEITHKNAQQHSEIFLFGQALRIYAEAQNVSGYAALFPRLSDRVRTSLQNIIVTQFEPTPFFWNSGILKFFEQVMVYVHQVNTWREINFRERLLARPLPKSGKTEPDQDSIILNEELFRLVDGELVQVMSVLPNSIQHIDLDGFSKGNSPEDVVNALLGSDQPPSSEFLRQTRAMMQRNVLSGYVKKILEREMTRIKDEYETGTVTSQELIAQVGYLKLLAKNPRLIFDKSFIPDTVGANQNPNVPICARVVTSVDFVRTLVGNGNTDQKKAFVTNHFQQDTAVGITTIDLLNFYNAVGQTVHRYNHLLVGVGVTESDSRVIEFTDLSACLPEAMMEEMGIKESGMHYSPRLGEASTHVYQLGSTESDTSTSRQLNKMEIFDLFLQQIDDSFLTVIEAIQTGVTMRRRLEVWREVMIQKLPEPDAAWVGVTAELNDPKNAMPGKGFVMGERTDVFVLSGERSVLGDSMLPEVQSAVEEMSALESSVELALKVQQVLARYKVETRGKQSIVVPASDSPQDWRQAVVSYYETDELRRTQPTDLKLNPENLKKMVKAVENEMKVATRWGKVNRVETLQRVLKVLNRYTAQKDGLFGAEYIRLASDVPEDWVKAVQALDQIAGKNQASQTTPLTAESLGKINTDATTLIAARKAEIKQKNDDLKHLIVSTSVGRFFGAYFVSEKKDWELGSVGAVGMPARDMDGAFTGKQKNFYWGEGHVEIVSLFNEWSLAFLAELKTYVSSVPVADGKTETEQQLLLLKSAWGNLYQRIERLIQNTFPQKLRLFEPRTQALRGAAYSETSDLYQLLLKYFNELKEEINKVLGDEKIA